ncbi:hypothetical protein ID866_3529 [Astraeus odoratus]|nr:hypothetical protein ID866_3529 [Astraeus odoratus]
MVWNLYSSVLHDAFRTVIPYPEDSIPFTPYCFLYLVVSTFPLVYMAYLARRPNTYLLRLMLLPATVLVLLGTYYRFKLVSTSGAPLNWGLGKPSIFIVNSWRAVETPEGMLKLGEEKPGIPIKSGQHDNSDASPDASSRVPPTIWERRLPGWLYDSLELLSTVRGIGWKFGTGLYVPKEHRPLERSAFLSATLVTSLQNFLVFDACESFIKLVPGVGSPEGGTIFRPELPTLQRFLLSTAVHIATGSSICAGFELSYDILTLIGVGLLSQDPSSWPPVMDHPWQSDSLHVFWAKRWHQILRETFFIYGGFIGRFLAGNIGTVFGTFIGSALFHESAAYAMGSGFDTSVLFFFTLQAPLLILERLWTRTTGHRVKGMYGRLWVYFCILILGQPLGASHSVDNGKHQLQ